MGKTKRRLNEAREASVRPMYVSVSFLACFLSLSPFLSSISLLVLPAPFENVLSSAPVLRVSTRSPLSSTSPPTIFGFLSFFFFFQLYLILCLRSINPHVLYRLRTINIECRALSVHIWVYGYVSAFIYAPWPLFAPSGPCILSWMWTRT